VGVVMHGGVDLLVSPPLSVSKRFVPRLALCWELYAGTKRFEWVKDWLIADSLSSQSLCFLWPLEKIGVLALSQV